MEVSDARKKTRTKSLDQFWKIDDEQLKTPEHDRMLLWLLKKDNLMKIIISKNPEACKMGLGTCKNSCRGIYSFKQRI